MDSTGKSIHYERKTTLGGSMSDWQNIGGVIQIGFALPPMDMNKEHIFKLLEVKPKPQIQTKFGIKDKIQFIWEEVGPNEKECHRVWIEFNQSFSEKSNLVAFLTKASPKPILSGTPILLGEVMAIGMQIRAFVKARIGDDGMPNGYYDFIPASIKPLGAQSTITPPLSKPDATLTNALLLAKGAKDSMEAYFKLADAKAPVDLIAIFVQADKLGQVSYPI